MIRYESSTKHNILGVLFDNLKMSDALNAALSLLAAGKKANIFFVNSDCLHKAINDQDYKNILNTSELVLPDGIGFKVASGIFGCKIRDNCNGSDFSPLFMQKAGDKGCSVFLLGGRDGVAERAGRHISKMSRNLRIAGSHCGYFSDDTSVIEKINSSGADILFVAMGAPLQEKWISRNRERLDPRICVGVGALFDYLSGTVPRAPKAMRNLRLEWLWRMLIEPRRMFKRYVIDGAKLFLFISGQKLRF